LGYYYLSVANPTLQGLAQSVAFLRNEWGFEGYYNLAVTPWAIFTPDIQVVAPTQKRQVSGGTVDRIGTATVLGVRLRIVF